MWTMLGHASHSFHVIVAHSVPIIFASMRPWSLSCAHSTPLGSIYSAQMFAFPRADCVNAQTDQISMAYCLAAKNAPKGETKERNMEKRVEIWVELT